MREKWIAAGTVLLLGVLCPYLILRICNREAAPQMVTMITEQAKTEASPEEERILSVKVLDREGTVQTQLMDDYLTCVLLCEVPASFELEALKAQAVVARTYTLRRVEKGSKHQNAAVCMDPGCCQGYKSVEEYLKAGGKSDDVDKLRSAVSQTEKLVLTYGGELIEATYFSCSGGYTEDAAAVWGSDIPYLKATKSSGEEGASHYTDTVTFTAAEFSRRLKLNAAGNAATWIEKITYTAGGGVGTMRICGQEYSGTQLRQLLELRSTAFAITALGDSVTITTKGFGHRVGMSQYGADAMAVDGKTCEQILLHYYQGVQLVQYTGSD